MKITEQHVSDDTLSLWVDFYEQNGDMELLKALLELVQRRAEDRQREADNGNAQ